MHRLVVAAALIVVFTLGIVGVAETQTCPEGRVFVNHIYTGDYTCEEGLLPLQDPETGELTCPEGQVRIQDPETEEVLCFEGQAPVQNPEETNEPCPEGQTLVVVGEHVQKDVCVTAEQTEQEKAAMNRLDVENLCPEGQVPVQGICLTGQLPKTDPQTGELTCPEGQVLVSVGEGEQKNACVTASEQLQREEPLYEGMEETAPATPNPTASSGMPLSTLLLPLMLVAGAMLMGAGLLIRNRSARMSSSNLIWLGSLAVMVGGVLLLAFPLLSYGMAYSTHPFFYLVDDVMLVSIVVALFLVPVGMVGFHALQRHRYGRIGVAGFWLTVITSLVVAWGAADFFIFGDMLQDAPPPTLTWGVWGLMAGFVLYGVATLQARVLPRWCGVAFIVALPFALVLSGPLPFAFVFVVFGLVWLALGYMLWRRSHHTQRNLSRPQR